MCVWVVHKYFGFVEEDLFSDDLVEGLIPNESINKVIIRFISISVVFWSVSAIFAFFPLYGLTFWLNKCKKTVKQKPALDQVYKAREKR